MKLLHPFNQAEDVTVANDGVCCRLAYKWLAGLAKPGAVKHPGAVTSLSFNQAKTVDKQAGYLKATEPFEKGAFNDARRNISRISEQFLNTWGAKHGLQFAAVRNSTSCLAYFSKNPERSTIIGIFGKTPDQKIWAHATAFYSGPAGRRFFDANKGEFEVQNSGAALGDELDQFHRYLARTRETMEQFDFFVVM